MKRLKKTMIKAEHAERYLEKRGSHGLKSSASLYDLLKRPEVDYESMEEIDIKRPELSSHEIDCVEVNIKYEGYIKKQIQQVAKFKRMENKKLSEELDYSSIEGLRLEAVQKLNRIKPMSIGQASRISGVSPADINVLLVYLEKMRRSE